MQVSERGNFGSKFGVIAAAAGSAVGLGNIWRFPYVAGENGGGAFLLVYLGFILLIGIPVMLSELSIGRSAQLNAFGSFKKLAPGKPWYLIGLLGIVAAFVILSFYSTVAGWTLEYVYTSIANAHKGFTPEQFEQTFETFKSGTFRPVFWQMIFMALTAGIVLAGVQKGIEKYTKALMPLLFVLIVILCIRSVTLPGAKSGLEFLFKPDFSKINANVILEALGQAFFSLSIGMGTLITYGSYIRKDNNLPKIATQVSLTDTLIAILAGVAIFPAVFAFNIEPNSGPGLVFLTLPNIFQQMAGGYVFAILFFILLSVAALTSSISVLEVVVAYMVEELKMPRKKATIISSSAIALVGLACTLSWSTFKDIGITFNQSATTDMAMETSEKMLIFDIFDFAASNIFLPLGGVLIVIF
jgi:NSS family neurotransmitter:Na+ symporter